MASLERPAAASLTASQPRVSDSSSGIDRAAANAYLQQAAAGEYLKTDTVLITVSVGPGTGTGFAWGCDLSYDYVKINAEYTT